MTSAVTPAALQAEGIAIAEELKLLLADAEDSAWGARFEALRTRLQQSVRDAERAMEPRLKVYRERLGQLASAVEAWQASPARTWEAFRREVQPAVEALNASLKELPSRPSNARRMVFHVLMGLGCTALVYAIPWRWLLIACPFTMALFAWGSEISRARSPQINKTLMRYFGPIAHAHEWKRVNSATWYVTALLILASFYPLTSCALAVLTLGLGDPAAALVGRRWGKTRLRSGRSLEGTLAFVAVATLACFALLVGHAHLGAKTALVVALVAGVSGAIAEVFSTRVDDNFSIPLSVGTATALALWLLK